MSQTIRQRQAIVAYIAHQAMTPTHNVRAAADEFRRSTARQPAKPQAVRRRRASEVITVACEKFVDHSWWLLAAIPLAAALLQLRAQGSMP